VEGPGLVGRQMHERFAVAAARNERPRLLGFLLVLSYEIEEVL
jgi:hypothetical protein